MEHFIFVWKNTFNYKGRATRSEYWYFNLFNLILYGLLWGLLFLDETLALVPLLYVFISYLPYFSVTARRLHDVDKSGWFQLISFIPFIGIIWLFVLMLRDGQKGPNKYGQDPKENVLV